MKKTIVVVYGRSNEGKSETIKAVCQKLLEMFPNAKKHLPEGVSDIQWEIDILAALTVNGVKIGFESQGDPKSRMVEDETLELLASSDGELGNCDIIFCATRTRGETIRTVENVANKHDYYTIWSSSLFGPNLDTKILNDIAADAFVQLVISLILNRI